MEEQPRREITPQEVFNRALHTYIKDLTTPDSSAEVLNYPYGDYPIRTWNKYGQELSRNLTKGITELEVKEGCKHDPGFRAGNGMEYVYLRAHEAREGRPPEMVVKIIYDGFHPNNMIKIVQGDKTTYDIRLEVSILIDPFYNAAVRQLIYEESSIDVFLKANEKSDLLKIEGPDAMERYKRLATDPKVWYETILFALDDQHKLHPNAPSFTYFLHQTHRELSEGPKNLSTEL